MHYYILLLDKFDVEVSKPYHAEKIRDECAYLTFAHTNVQRHARLWRATMGTDGKIVYGEEFSTEELNNSLAHKHV